MVDAASAPSLADVDAVATPPPHFFTAHSPSEGGPLLIVVYRWRMPPYFFLASCQKKMRHAVLSGIPPAPRGGPGRRRPCRLKNFRHPGRKFFPGPPASPSLGGPLNCPCPATTRNRRRPGLVPWRPPQPLRVRSASIGRAASSHGSAKSHAARFVSAVLQRSNPHGIWLRFQSTRPSQFRLCTPFAAFPAAAVDLVSATAFRCFTHNNGFGQPSISAARQRNRFLYLSPRTEFPNVSRLAGRTGKRRATAAYLRVTPFADPCSVQGNFSHNNVIHPCDAAFFGSGVPLK